MLPLQVGLGTQQRAPEHPPSRHRPLMLREIVFGSSFVRSPPWAVPALVVAWLSSSYASAGLSGGHQSWLIWRFPSKRFVESGPCRNPPPPHCSVSHIQHVGGLFLGKALIPDGHGRFVGSLPLHLPALGPRFCGQRIDRMSMSSPSIVKMDHRLLCPIRR